MTRRNSIGAASLLVLLTACGSPSPDVEVGFKEVPSNVLLGAPPSSPAALPATQAPGPVFLPPPSVISLPPAPFAPLPPGGPRPEPAPIPSAPACPVADPLAAPKLEAPTTIDRPPVSAAYVFDNVGTFAVSGADARTGRFPDRTVRLFDKVQGSEDVFQYDVSERIGDVTTTTTYIVVRRTTLPGQEPGLFLGRTTYARADGSSATFDPTPRLKLASLPLLRGARTDQRAVDANSGTVMSFTSTVEGKARVFACGEPLDTWTIRLSAGRLLSPDQDLDFSASYQLGTQFGGIIVADAVAYQGEDGASGVQRSNKASIAAVPRKP